MFPLSINKLNKKHLIVLLGAFYVFFYFAICTNIPYGDDFWFLKSINDFYHTNLFIEKIKVLVSQFNLGLNFNNEIDYTEHRHIIQKLIFIIDIYLTGKIHIKFYLFLNILTLLLLYNILYVLLKEYLQNNYVFIIVFFILFSWVNYLNIAWMSSFSNNLLLVAGFYSFYLTTQKKYIISNLFLVIALLSSYGAFIFYIINIGWLLFHKKKILVLYLTMLFISKYLYSIGIKEANHVDLLIKLKYFWYILWLFLCSIGSIGLSIIPATLLGILYLIFFLLLIKKKMYAKDTILFFLIITLFIMCFGIAFQRVNLGFDYILNTRFRQFSMLLTGFYAIALHQYYPVFFNKFKTYFVALSISYFIIGNCISFHFAYKRKIALIEGVKKYKQHKTGLFIYKGMYENEQAKIKVDEVNKIMKSLIEDKHYELP